MSTVRQHFVCLSGASLKLFQLPRLALPRPASATRAASRACFNRIKRSGDWRRVFKLGTSLHLIQVSYEMGYLGED